MKEETGSAMDGKEFDAHDAKDETDPKKSFPEEKLKMSAAKCSMTKRVKREETMLTEFKELNNMDNPNIIN